jgi:hypothetical protein
MGIAYIRPLHFYRHFFQSCKFFLTETALFLVTFKNTFIELFLFLKAAPVRSALSL